MTKQKVTVTPDTGNGVNLIDIEGLSGTFGIMTAEGDPKGNVLQVALYHAIERISELEEKTEDYIDRYTGLVGELKHYKEKAHDWESRADRKQHILDEVAANLSDIKTAIIHAAYHPGLEAITKFITQEMMDGSGSDCLAQRDARMKAEALETLADYLSKEGHAPWEHQEFGDGLLRAAQLSSNLADEYRQSIEDE